MLLTYNMAGRLRLSYREESLSSNVRYCQLRLHLNIYAL